MARGRNLRPEAANGKRFGDPGGADPRKATKMGPPKWSIRKALSHMAVQEVDPNDKSAMRKLLGPKPTLAQVIAAALLMKASKGFTDAINLAIENIDGRLPQETQLTGKDGAPLAQPVIYLPANARDSN